MNKFEEYNASVLVNQATLLKKFECLIKYLTKNPTVNIYIYNGNFLNGTLNYQTSDIDKRNHVVTKDDLILFKNGYVAIIDSIGESYFTISNNFAFQGPKGDTGEQGTSITNVQISENNHLIVTLSNGQNIDAGNIITGNLFQMGTYFFNPETNIFENLDSVPENYNGIAYYFGDDLFEVYSYSNGVVEEVTSISSSDIYAKKIFGDEIVEEMSGYSAQLENITNLTVQNIYTGVVKNGNKLTIVCAVNIVRTDDVQISDHDLLSLVIPESVGQKLFPTTISQVATCLSFHHGKAIRLYAIDQSYDLDAYISKVSNTSLKLKLVGSTINNLGLNNQAYYRIEATFLLSNNLVG